MSQLDPSLLLRMTIQIMKKYVLLFFVLFAFLTYVQGETMAATEPLSPMAFEAGKKYLAVIHTVKGDITCELNTAKAPLSSTNFINLAKGKFYDGLTFHRVEPGFVIQGGDPSGNGTGGPGYTVAAEIGLAHIKGALAMARQGDQVNPLKKSSGSQFYITLEATPFLDGAYTVFGQTLKGMDVVQKIVVGDKITSIEIMTQ